MTGGDIERPSSRQMCAFGQTRLGFLIGEDGQDRTG